MVTPRHGPVEVYRANNKASAESSAWFGGVVVRYVLPPKAKRRCSESVERAVAMERCALALEDAGMDKAASVVRDYAKSCSLPACKARKKPRPIAFECKRYGTSEWRPERAPKPRKGERRSK